MISYQRDQQQTIPDSQVKIIGLGGAGANMLDRVALDGMEGVELLAINTDVRTLSSSVASEKIQLGRSLTKGLGCGGDPELGLKAVKDAETEIRDSLKNRRIVFLCVGLGGGTGSGAAPMITRIAREEGAFVVIFATMPFQFEGHRRYDQAKTALNELAALSNALVTFDNGRMGELVVAKQGIHEAFSAADRMISESIRAVTRLVSRPGLVNVGLDDLMTALRSTRSRCLFGSGLGRGQNRSQEALKNALASPLLDRGSLLKDAETVLVHICGGEDLTLYEVELLMRGLSKHVPANAHVLFGAAIDSGMNDALSITIISSLPEEKLQMNQVTTTLAPEVEEAEINFDEPVASEPVVEEIVEETPEPEPAEEIQVEALINEVEPEAISLDEEVTPEEVEEIPVLMEEVIEGTSDEAPAIEEESAPEPILEEEVPFETQTEVIPEVALDIPEPAPKEELSETEAQPAAQAKDDQIELELEGGAKGRFKGQAPTLFDGEDLDVPPYLRRKS